MSLKMPEFTSFSLTHIVYDPSSPFSLPLTLLSLSPIFLFVSYFTLLIFTRRLTILLLALGQIANELLSLVLKEAWKAERPFPGYGEVGRGYGMPSSHSQAAGFLVAWGVGYAMTSSRRYGVESDEALKLVRKWRLRVYVFGLVLWSSLVAYSRCVQSTVLSLSPKEDGMTGRWHLIYHSIFQVSVGYTIGLLAGTVHFIVTEYIPLYHPTSMPGRIRAWLSSVWEGIGGVGGWQLGGAEGGWGEGDLILRQREKVS